MKQIGVRFLNSSWLVQLITFLCGVGFLINLFLLGRDFYIGGILWRLHLAFALLYGSQVVFILLGEKYVCLLTALQGFLALLTTADFIFVPLLRLIAPFYYALGEPTVEGMKVYKYVFVSLAFTLQMYSAYVLFADLQEK